MNTWKFLFGISIVMSIGLPSVCTLSNLTIIDWTTCEPRDYVICKCTSDTMTNVVARCNFKHVTGLNLIVKAPKDVLRLNISGNSIQEIPSRSFNTYSNLFYLSLASNNIHTISQGAFSGLEKLRELNLQDNMIKQWDTTMIEQDLPNLIMLNTAQNIYWKPDQQIMSLPSLKIIYLILTYSENSLFRCYLVQRTTELHAKNYSFISTLSKNILKAVSPEESLKSDNCEIMKLVFRDSNYQITLKDNGYYFHCENLKTALLFEDFQITNVSNVISQPEQWYNFRKSTWSYCWDSIQMIHILTSAVGIFTLTLNLIVIITTLRSRVLRESVAHVLVANIAMGDMLFSLYIIVITSTRQILDAIEYEDLYLPYYCRIVGLFFLIGQFVSPVMSFIMTLERYLAVVHCMRPHIRITIRSVYTAMVIVWSLCLSLAISFMTSPQFSRQTDSMCIPSSNTNKIKVLSYLVGFMAFILYILSMALYGHMYLDFQKTNQKTVQLQRENRLARRIALILFTNVLFFIIPLVAIATIPRLLKGISEVARYIFLKTFGITCLGMNSCLNPVLFSFRNGVFRNEFRKLCLCCRAQNVAAHP